LDSTFAQWIRGNAEANVKSAALEAARQRCFHFLIQVLT
jgi:hypothetical protein